MRRREKETVTSRWSRLVFDGDEKNYELWETMFLGHLYLQGLKETILSESFEEDEEDTAKNAEAYAELIQFLDDKSLSLVMREAADDGRAALKILQEYYAGKGKPRVISLYTELTSLQKSHSEYVTDYVIRAETAITALRNAGVVQKATKQGHVNVNCGVVSAEVPLTVMQHADGESSGITHKKFPQSQVTGSILSGQATLKCGYRIPRGKA
ncbi:uncharacterized protein [Sinocyclocheilus grahami]|uniref:uncharacterized protein n=1 Tax=Sinocyclocheilus grahami TaxID=75366 RepID=UPI0007AC97F2|nr:PREDICTED: uncharacterized protein LOC107571892 [Sinocyclocheilus grahami]